MAELTQDDDSLLELLKGKFDTAIDFYVDYYSDVVFNWDVRSHEYQTYEWIAPADIPGIDINTVFEALKSHPAPLATGVPVIDGTSADVFIGDYYLGEVVHYVDPETYTVSNVTTDNHRLHLGVVYRKVIVKDGWYVIETTGVGVGGMATLNELGAEHLWGKNGDEIRSKVVELGGEETKKYEEEIKSREDRCFSAGTLIDMADGSQKPIEQIKVGDEVLAYDPAESDGRDALKPARVARTMVNQVEEIIDFHGVKMTPGHATLCGDGPHQGRHIPIMDILLADGAIVNREGELIRAATNLPVDSEGDQFVTVAYILDKSQSIYHKGRMRAGTLMIGQNDGPDWRVMEALKREGYVLHSDGLISKEGEAPHPLYWFGPVPKPEDYVLAKSRLTIGDLYSRREVEGSCAIGANLPQHAGMTVQ